MGAWKPCTECSAQVHEDDEACFHCGRPSAWKHNSWVDNFTVKQLKKLSPSLVLDVVCGDGFYGRLCEHVLGASVNVLGVDINPRWYKHCLRLEEYSNVKYGNIIDLLPQLQGELAIAGDVLEHLEEEEMLKVLDGLVNSFEYVIVNSPLEFQPQTHEDIWECHRCGLNRKTFDEYSVIEYNESKEVVNDLGRSEPMFNILIKGKK